MINRVEELLASSHHDIWISNREKEDGRFYFISFSALSRAYTSIS